MPSNTRIQGVHVLPREAAACMAVRRSVAFCVSKQGVCEKEIEKEREARREKEKKQRKRADDREAELREKGASRESNTRRSHRENTDTPRELKLHGRQSQREKIRWCNT